MCRGFIIESVRATNWQIIFLQINELLEEIDLYYEKLREKINYASKINFQNFNNVRQRKETRTKFCLQQIIYKTLSC